MSLETSAVKRVAHSLAKFAGKGDQKVIAVFGLTPAACQKAVAYVRAQAPETPVWLFCAAEPLPETAPMCERVSVHRNSLIALLKAERLLWPRCVAIGVGTWTGDRGGWALKLAPFLVPPFRTLLMNSHGDFLSGFSLAVFIHVRLRFRDAARSYWYKAADACREARDRVLDAWHRTQDLSRGYWRLVTHHIWRSGPCTRIKEVTCSFSLRAAAAVLKRCAYPHRAWFRRLHGNQALRVYPLPASGAGLFRYVQTGPNWRGKEFEAAVRSSGARWILWQEHGAADPVDRLLPLFEDGRTFAVSIQCHYRGWKPSLLPMAPFRTLQPDEASPVLAPVSRTIVVDRQKLEALGIPRCDLTGTAWLVLFWKAAAAGWHSYSAGQSGQLTEPPDHPILETAFFLRLLANPEIRKLCPAEPDLSRGNRAFGLASRPVPSLRNNRLKVLIVSPFLPWPLSHGGAVRIYNLCRAFRDRVDFILVSVREREDAVDYEKLREVFREVHVVDLDEAASTDERLPTQVRQHQSRSLRALVRDISRRCRLNLVQIEYTHMASFQDAASELPSILVEHDLTFSLYRQLAEVDVSDAARREYERWHAFERRQLRAFDAVWTMSGEDRRLAVQEGSGPDRTFTVPNGVDTSRFIPWNEIAAPPEILYVGSFRHLPNILGFEKLCRHVMPRVWDRHPEVRLRVVAGPQHETFWRRYRGDTQTIPVDDRIEVHGFVEDLRPLYAKASVVAVPLEVSAGTNIKVLEAMACGKAIVTTPAGCAGLGLRNGREALIRRDPAEFAGALCRVLSNHELRMRLASQARQTAEERFSWAAIADRAYESYLAVVGLEGSGTMAPALLGSSSAAD